MSIFVRDGDLKEYFKKAPVTSILIIINLIILLVVLVTGGFTSTNLFNLGALWAPVVKDGEWWRIISSMFLHGSIIHFISNGIIGLYILSSSLERLIGSRKFAVIYFLSGIGAGLLVTFTSNNLTIGASGAIFGALGSLLFITIYRKDLMSVSDAQSIKGLVLMNMVFTFLMSNISIAGHVGGIITGFLLSYLLIKRNKVEVYDNNFRNLNSYENFDSLEDNDPWEI